MNPVLNQLEAKLAYSLHSLDASQTQLRLTPNPTCWTIQQITEHLLMTYASTSNAFESRLAKGTPTQSRPAPSHRVQQFVVITLGLMPGRRKAPPEVTPVISDPLSGDELTVRMRDALALLDLIFNQAEHAFGAVRCLTHFALGPLSSAQWRRFHLSHGNHHVRQIMAIRRIHGL